MPNAAVIKLHFYDDITYPTKVNAISGSIANANMYACGRNNKNKTIPVLRVLIDGKKESRVQIFRSHYHLQLYTEMV